MLVGIEASSAVSGTRTGVGTYTANMIAGLQRAAEREGGLQFVYFSNRSGLEDTTGDGEPLPIYPHDRMPLRSLWIQLGLRRSIARLRPDICHFPNHLAPVLGRSDLPYVVTMHDMSIYRCPEYQSLKTLAVHRSIIPLVARRQCLIVTVSESARQDIIYYLKVPEEQVRVVYEGIGPQYRPRSGENSAAISGARLRHQLQFPYILTVGTLEPRKNQARLIDAFSWLVQQERLPHHLVLVGAHGWKEQSIMSHVRRSPVSDRIHVLGYVPSGDLPGLYGGADAFAFPSLYEGFGLPVLEALACGVPTLISNDSALTEVAGDGSALVVEPRSVQDIAAGLHMLLCDRTTVAGLRARGFARAREFSWDKCAGETLGVYRDVLAGQPEVRRIYATT